MEQKQIIDHLATDHGLEADRKTVRNNVKMIIELGHPVERCERGIYYEHPFDDSELRMLIDSLPEQLPANQRAQIVKKLSELSSVHFSTWDDGSRAPEGTELLYTLDVLQEAIRKRCCVSFHYGHHDIDKELHLRTDRDGEVKDYVVSPYRTLISCGHYLLLCNTMPHPGPTHYRIDRIRGIRLLPDRRAVSAEEAGVAVADIAGYLSQRPYMYSDRAIRIHLRVARSKVDDVLDWFGTDVKFRHADEDTVEAVVMASPTATRYWALQYGEVCEILSPIALRRQMAQITDRMAARYADSLERKGGDHDEDR